MGGLFGVASKQDCVRDLFYGTDYHFHLGTRRGGMAVKNSDEIKRSIHNIENDYFRSKFEADLAKFEGTLGIGVISDYDAQPLVIGSHLGTFAIVTVGPDQQHRDTGESRPSDGRLHFTETAGGQTNPTEMVAMLICEEESFEAGIRHAQEVIEGSCSLLLLTEDGIYAARDRLGRTPLVIGKKEGAYAVASESCAFPNLGYEVDDSWAPGKRFSCPPTGGNSETAPANGCRSALFCGSTTGTRPPNTRGSTWSGSATAAGPALARNDDDEVDIVAGIPDSGIGHAIGYANEKKIPYVRPFVKYTPTWPRSFMPQNQMLRDLVARMKLIPIRQLIDGQADPFLRRLHRPGDPAQGQRSGAL